MRARAEPAVLSVVKTPFLFTGLPYVTLVAGRQPHAIPSSASGRVCRCPGPEGAQTVLLCHVRLVREGEGGERAAVEEGVAVLLPPSPLASTSQAVTELRLRLLGQARLL
ncbi:hypothetical protein GCM10023324_26770 [Streptomyces youssoufiensis]